MAEQNVKNEIGIGRIISKKITPLDRATPNIIAFEGRLITLENEVDAIDLSTKLDVDEFTGAEILLRLITVDGPGSGLNADLLDNHDSAYFAVDGHTHDERYYTESEANSRYLGINAKAADSNLLDAHDSTYFAPQATTYTKIEVDNLFNEDGFSQNFVEDGWCTMPNGLILQWGSKRSDNQGEETFYFPLIFTHECFNVQLTVHGSGIEKAFCVTNKYTNRFTIDRDNDMSDHNFYFFAIGH